MGFERRSGCAAKVAGAAVVACLAAGPAAAQSASPDYAINDSHFHLTNYVQKGTEIRRFLEIMSDTVGRVALFGIPLQQTWSYENSGEYGPTYYLQSDAPLYYYSFTDAWIATQYLSLSAEQRARFDPMITGFNPADMYAVDHIKRVLETFPGVFTGIGEFTIHKEFVSSKVAGDVASLTDPALDRILEFCAESGLLVIMHNDLDMPFAKPGTEPVFLAQAKAVLKSHPKATIIWAHTGLGRVVHPVQGSASAPGTERSPGHLDILADLLADAGLSHVYFDISWSEVAKYVVATPESLQRSAALIERHPDRFLFGTDEVAPEDQESYLGVYRQYEPLWQALSPATSARVRLGNYERLFDAAAAKVRAWESSRGLTPATR